MKKLFLLFVCLVSLTPVTFSQKIGESLLSEYSLLKVPNAGGRCGQETLDMFVRKSDWKIGFCNGRLEVIAEPCFFEAYNTVPDKEYPVIAVCDYETRKWGFFSVGLGEFYVKYCKQLVYKCVFDEIDYESLEHPFYDGTAKVKYKGKWITLNIEDDMKNGSPLLTH